MNIKGKLFQSALEEKRHYKMYKSGRTWVVAGISLLFAGALMVAKPESVSAAEDVVVPTAVSVKASTSAPAVQEKQQDKATDAVETLDTTSDSANADADAMSVQMSEKNVAKNNVTSQPKQPDQGANDNVKSVDNQTVEKSDQSDAAVVDGSAKDVVGGTKDANQSAVTTTNLGDADAQKVATAKAKAKAEFENTGRAQNVTASDGEPQSSISGESEGSFTINSTTDGSVTVGHGSGATNLVIELTMTNPQAGDTYALTVPDSDAVLGFGAPDPISSSQGTTKTIKNSDGTQTILNTFSSALVGHVNQTITYSFHVNSRAQSTPIPNTGLTTRSVSLVITTHDGAGQPQTTQVNQTFKTDIEPQISVGSITRTKPSTDAFPDVIPGNDYVYNLVLNADDGVLDDSAMSHTINSAVNYGATITVPVPQGFVLNSQLTKTLNSIVPDSTSITQTGGAGSNIEIVVPKGSGTQQWNYVPGYRFAGHYENVTQTDQPQQLTATGNVEVHEDFGFESVAVDGKKPWTDTLAPVGNQAGVVDLTTKGLATSNLVITTDPQTDAVVDSFSFDYEALQPTTSAQLKITVPDGLDISKIQVPTDAIGIDQYLPGTTKYGYKMYLNDSTTPLLGTIDQGGILDAGTGASIKSVVFTPNYLAPGASSANTSLDANNKGAFQLIGKLSKESITAGSKLTSTIDFTVPKVTNKGDANFAEATTEASDPVANAGAYVVQNHPQGADDSSTYEPGVGGGQFTVVGGSYGNGQSTHKVFEPILYYVLPKVVQVDSVEKANGAKVSQSVTADGRTIVTFDFSGTNTSVDFSNTGDFAVVNVTNKADALPGKYPWNMYIYSPTTKLNSDKQINSDSDPRLNEVDVAADGINPNAIEMSQQGSGFWEIDVANSNYQVSLAKGDEANPVVHATVDKHHDSQDLQFTTSILNVNSDTTDPSTDNVIVLNLPTTGYFGSGYTFDLTEPITLPAEFTTNDESHKPINATVYYSTEQAQLTAGATTFNMDRTYTVEEPKNLSTIRSIVIKLGDMPPMTSTGSIVLHGKIENLHDQEGLTGYLETAHFEGNKPVALNNQQNAPSLKVEGPSFVRARAHYVDDNGVSQYILFSDLDQQLNDNDSANSVKPFQASPTSQDILSIPAGYALKAGSLHYLDAKGNELNSTAVAALIGHPITNAEDGDIAQYELVPIKREMSYGSATTTRTINYVVTGDPSLNPDSETQTIEWKTTTDPDTDKTVATPQNVFETVDSPRLAGYTADKLTVVRQRENPTDSTLPDNTVVTVTYTKNVVINTPGGSQQYRGQQPGGTVPVTSIPGDPEKGRGQQPGGVTGPQTQTSPNGGVTTLPDLPGTFGTNSRIGKTPTKAKTPANGTGSDNNPDLPSTYGVSVNGHNGSYRGKAGDMLGADGQLLTSNEASTSQTFGDKAGKKNLPQTGESHNVGLIALGMTMLGSLMTLADKRRKQD
ncbi:KxYKxGKxW signal peptide domain-containing protein [Lacticaseibacillus pabuli]|uniref:KxYKxGKxW signal peptide domain-containing protein n=1 Tax=Lacticaseibacillus pabuli TaxID=3025672 RepID=A0ABY7WSS8_9LACO|nr:KxYKxGKxW signal peptide domain-containing protein [Lacticaseibacillus sp. KACC 23028]WDF83233.1 KxYKxGKxW signal peptide domain-containing protein [Lacticaseibacillus sp. KACC 23028]